MSSIKKVHLAFLWRMHQPWYRDPVSREMLLPWVRLHAASSYSDMAAHLARHPKLHSTVCFSPALLDQIELYVEGGGDHYIDLTLLPPQELSGEQRGELMQLFFSLHWDQVLLPMARYRQLLELRGREQPPGNWEEVHGRFSDQDLRDLQVLFNLAWLGHHAADDDEIRGLLERGRDYSEEHKQIVLGRQRVMLQQLLPAWRELVSSGSVEISGCPYYHPLLPLIIDCHTARRPTPRVTLPERFAQPDDAAWQISRALERIRQVFGHRPVGLWPPEGAISPETVRQGLNHRLRYLAADARVLFHSLDQRGSAPGRQRIYQPYNMDSCAVFFRDTELSARIATEYPRWTNQQAAAADFIEHVLAVAERARVDDGAPPLVLVALAGDHHWESYPGRGAPFIEALYSQLDQTEAIRTVTLEEHLQEHPPTIGLDHLHSGSWVEGNFALWIGDPEKNAAWNRLQRTRTRVTRARSTGEASEEALSQAMRHIYRAEGSDWYYWMGEPFYPAEGATYEYLFKAHLMAAYQALGDNPPADLSRPIEQGGVVTPLRQPSAFIQPSLSGRRTSFYEWREAGFYRVPAGGSVYSKHGFLAGIYWGFDAGRMYLRLDPLETYQRGAHPMIRDTEIWIELTEPHRCFQAHLIFEGTPELALRTCANTGDLGDLGMIEAVAVQEVIELALPLSRMGLGPGARMGLIIHFARDGEEISRVPPQGVIEVEVPAHGYETGPSFKI